MQRIRINPEQVRQTASQFRHAKERVYQAFEQWQRAMTQFVDRLDGAGL